MAARRCAAAPPLSVPGYSPLSSIARFRIEISFVDDSGKGETNSANPHPAIIKFLPCQRPRSNFTSTARLREADSLVQPPSACRIYSSRCRTHQFKELGKSACSVAVRTAGTLHWRRCAFSATGLTAAAQLRTRRSEAAFAGGTRLSLYMAITRHAMLLPGG